MPSRHALTPAIVRIHVSRTHATVAPPCAPRATALYDWYANTEDTNDWFLFCTSGRRFPKPDASPTADVEAFVHDWANLYFSGQCDDMLPFMSANYTQSISDGAPVDKAGTIANCKYFVGDLAFSVYTTSMFAVTPDAVQLNYVLSGTIKDPTTDQQCTVHSIDNSYAHTYVDPASGARVVDEYRGIVGSSFISDLVTKCHYKPGSVRV